MNTTSSNHKTSELKAVAKPCGQRIDLDASVSKEREAWSRVAEAAQAVTTGCEDKTDFFKVPSHLMAALALALDELPGRNVESEYSDTALQIGEASTDESSSGLLTSTEHAPDRFMVMDVESIGLHGEGFAVGWVVITRSGVKLDEGCIACDPELCNGLFEDRIWVRENVPELKQTSPTKQHLRNHFWHEWRSWAEQGAVLVADCSWPVESNFLSACVKLNPREREWGGPYPLHDLASVTLALGGDSLASTERLPDKLPAHHPLIDARQSARQLIAALNSARFQVKVTS